MASPLPSASAPLVHGHDVLHLALGLGRAVTRDELVAEVLRRFGPDARFHTCSAQGMTAEGIVDFLVGRGKFDVADGRLRTDPARICSHGDGEHHDHDHA